MTKKTRLTPIVLMCFTSAAHAQAALDESLLVGRFSQCSYNALSSVMVHFYGPLAATPDRTAFENDIFLGPLSSTAYGAYYGWGPWTSYMVNSGKMTWNRHAVTDLTAERFSLHPSADVGVTATDFVVKYAPGERDALRDKLLQQLARGPVLLWTPYAAAFGARWRHVKQVDEFTDYVRRTSATHTVALFLKPDNRVLVVDGSSPHGVYVVDPDLIVATSAAMTGYVRIEDEPGRSIYKNKLNGVANDEYNVTFVTRRPTTTAPAGRPTSDLQAQAVMLAGKRGGKKLPDAFTRAGPAADAWAAATVLAPAAIRDDVAFVVANMPATDLQTLSPAFIAQDVAHARAARDRFPWGAQVPEEIFRSAVLPYANLSETRENWRVAFAAKCGPLVSGCKTASQAALVLNEKLFPAIKVQYHATKRLRPDQSPSESVAAGYASCSGLSILLVDACRSVGIPARVVGTPLWYTGKGDAAGNHAGNHTWVEVWDGQWHVIGASEAGPIDQTWFMETAAKQSEAPAEERYRIYASSLDGDTHFRMGWMPTSKDVAAVDVTAHYARRRSIEVRVNADRLALRADQQLVADTEVKGHSVLCLLSEGQTYEATITRSGVTSRQVLKIEADTPSVLVLGPAK